MISVIAFDVYGTLIDPSGVVHQLTKQLGDQAIDFSNRWRHTQISYSFRRSILDDFVPFTQCTQDALEATCAEMEVELTPDQKEKLMQTYLELPTFPGVKEVLESLTGRGLRLYAFSNGAENDLEALFNFASIRPLFEGLISVGPTKKFKPDPAVYKHLIESVGDHNDLLFVSANPFDVQGAIKAGLAVVWLNRKAGRVFDPWGPQPSIEIPNLDGLLDLNVATLGY